MQVMKRWLDTGVDGFRLDAIPYLCERDGTNNENLPETHAIIKKLRAELDAYAKGKVLLAEANQWPEDVQEYFGHGDECHMAYHFPLMPRIYMAIAQEDRFPITDILRQTPDIPGNCQWALFLRNHDELTLEMVTDVERDYLWSTYANDPRARINVGIRRRLAPLMDNDRRKIELMNSLLMSFPGTPIIYYGDEIGMGDNIYLGDRNGVRTPMQWTPDRNGGFSRADPARLYAPMIMDPVYGYEAVNVEAQSRSLSSLLSATKRLIAVRKSTLAFGRGTMTFIRPENRSVLAYVRQYQRRGHPLRRQSVALGAGDRARSLRLQGPHSAGDAGPHAVSGDRRTALHDHARALRLLLVRAAGARQVASRSRRGPCRNSRRWWCRSVRPGCRWRANAACSNATCCRGIWRARRWYPERSAKAIHPTLTVGHSVLRDRRQPAWLAFFEAKQHGETARYVLPMQIEWVRFDREHYNPKALAAVRQGAREGTLLDVATDQIFIGLMLRNLREKLTVDESEQGLKLEFRPTSKFDDKTVRRARSIPRLRERQAQQHRAGRRRLFRQGLSQARTRHQSRDRGRPFPDRGRRLCQYAGAARQRRADRRRAAQRDRHRQRLCQEPGRRLDGDRRPISTALSRSSACCRPAATSRKAKSSVLSALHVAGRTAPCRDARRAGERQGSAGFRARPRSRRRISSCGSTTSWPAPDASSTRSGTPARRLSDAERPLVDQLLAEQTRLPDRLRALLPRDIDCLNIRHHGNLHLGHLLIVKDDIFIIDFEGEPRRSIAERRRKAPAARDLAGLIRSIDCSTTAALERGAEGHAGRARQARRRAGRMARPRHRGTPDRLPRNHDGHAALAVPGGYGRKAAQLLPA